MYSLGKLFFIFLSLITYIMYTHQFPGQSLIAKPREEKTVEFSAADRERNMIMEQVRKEMVSVALGLKDLGIDKTINSLYGFLNYTAEIIESEKKKIIVWKLPAY